MQARWDAPLVALFLLYGMLNHQTKCNFMRF